MDRRTKTICLVVLLSCIRSRCSVTCLSPFYTTDNDVVNDIIDDVSPHAQNGEFLDLDELGFGLNSADKRTTWSLNGELRSLADMVHQARRQGEHSAQISALLQQGKRSWHRPVLYHNDFKVKTNDNDRSPSVYPITRRSQTMLSVSGPLSALADMLAVEGRRRKHMESMQNTMRLLQSGKRSDDVLYFGDVDFKGDHSLDMEYL